MGRPEDGAHPDPDGLGYRPGNREDFDRLYAAVYPRILLTLRGRVTDASKEQLVVGTAGYLTSWAAMHPEWHGLHGALEQVGPILARYLESKGRTREADVVRKRARRLDVIGWADDPAEDTGDAA